MSEDKTGKARDCVAVIASSVRVADDTFEIVIKFRGLEQDGEPGPRPGQFAHIAIPGCFLRRPISVAGYDAKRRLARLIVQRAGEGGKILASLPAGGELRAMLPLGNSFPLKLARDVAAAGGEIWLVAGGIGLAPLLFAANRAKDAGARLRIFAGFRDAGRVFGLNEMKSYGDVRLSVGSLVTDDFSEALKESRPEILFSCGPDAMQKRLQEICGERGVMAFASLEERMGCGVGACLVCSRGVTSGGSFAYRRVCADGPVFNLAEVGFR
jgi:dihydroorotate dehydrogenase electron transfer subunit